MTTLASLKEWCKKHLDDETHRLPDAERDALRGIYAWAMQYQGEQFDHVLIDAVFAPHVIGAASDLLEKDRYNAILFGIWSWRISANLHMEPCTPGEIEHELMTRQRILQKLMYHDHQLADVLLLDVHNEGRRILNLASEKDCPDATMQAIRNAINTAHLVKQDKLQQIQKSVALLRAMRERYATSVADLDHIQQELLSQGKDEMSVQQLIHATSLALTVVYQVKMEEQLALIAEASAAFDQAFREIHAAYLSRAS